VRCIGLPDRLPDPLALSQYQQSPHARMSAARIIFIC
jgi:hypothetical protein